MQNAGFFIKYKLHHLLFWLLVFGIWFLLRYEGYASSTLAFKITLIKVVDLALMVYVTNYILIPFLLYKKRYVLFVITFIAMVLTSSFTKMYIIGQVANDPASFSLQQNLKARIYDNVIPHFFLVIAGAAIKFMFDQLRLQKKIADLAKEKAEAELNFLKSQINPHFLFNSLNSVYFLIDKNNPDARQALHKFSDMLRYQLYEADGEKIPIEKEIDYLQDYVHLQQLRKDENYKVQFMCSPDVKNFSIEPLLLIPFVENAFKHISHKADGNNFVKLDMSRNNGYFEFAVENSREKGVYTTEQHGGIGMNNVKRRLELLYPGTHQLSIDDKSNTFKISLKLKI
ncbi:MAG TPA: histidine kinase [Chitinophagaceae bacterium]|nr:histidine kinase [Chitinophagaceae bacterium]